MVAASLYEVVTFALPAILSLAVFLIAWIVSYRIALQRQSRGLLLVSRGFLVKWVIDGAWDAYYYVILGGPIGIINSIENQNQGVASVGMTLALYGWIGIGTSLLSISLMVFFVIKGALAGTSEQQARLSVTLPTSPQ